MKRALFVLVFLAGVATTPAIAGDRLGLGVKFGTLGLGVDLTGRINDWFCLRGTVNALDVNDDNHDEEGIDYDATFELGGAGVLADFHPTKGNFRLSVGYLFNRNDYKLKATPTENVTIGDTTYTPAEAGILDAEVTFRDAAPYAGIGYGMSPRGPGRVRFLLDAGVMYQGKPAATVTSTSPLVDPADLRQEEDEIEDNNSGAAWWPVFALGISFRL